MNDDLTSYEVAALDALFCRSLDAARLNGHVLTSLLARGLVEVTWAGRVRLTAGGRELFEVVVSA